MSISLDVYIERYKDKMFSLMIPWGRIVCETQVKVVEVGTLSEKLRKPENELVILYVSPAEVGNTSYYNIIAVKEFELLRKDNGSGYKYIW